MEAGDLVFVRGRGLIPDVIRSVDSGGPFSHVAIAISGTEILEANYGTEVHIIQNPYVDYEVVPLRLGSNNRLAEFTKRNVGKKYDYAELFIIWLRIVFGWAWFGKFNNAKEMVCSELAGAYLEFVHIAPKGEELLAPNELYRDIKGRGY